MYEEFYHLQAKPFRLSPDPRFFFESRGHKRALAYLRYGLNQSEGFVVITGEPGTGKTTLAQILLAEMEQTDIVVAHLTTTQLEADEMLRMVAASFGLRFDGVDKAGLLKTLEAFLLARSRERKRALLVVDEAQNLPPRSLEELRMLSNLQVGDHALLQTFLLGQVQFRQMLDHPDLEQLRQRVIANYHLSSLAEDECKSYIESRLSHVGWNHDPEFTDEAYDIIFNYTAGIPRRINMLCDRVLLFSCLESRHVIDKNLLIEVTNELQTEISGRPIQVIEEENLEPEEEIIERQAEDKHDTRHDDHVSTRKHEDPPSDGASSLRTPVADDQQEAEQVQYSAELSSVGGEPTETDAADVADVRSSTENNPKSVDTERSGQYSNNKVTKQHDSENSGPDDSSQENPGKNNPEMASKETQEPPVVTPAAISENRRGKPSEHSWNESVARKTRDDDLESSSNQQGEDVPEVRENVARAQTREKQPERFRVIAGGKEPDADRSRSRDSRQGDPFQGQTVVAAIPDASGDSEEVSLRKALRLVLAYHRSPRSFPGLDDPSQPIPKGMHALLALSASDNAVIESMRQIANMGISPAMLRAAVRYYIRRVLFAPGVDDYRVLGLTRDACLADVEEHYGYMMKLMRMDKQDADETSVAHIGHAYEHICRGELTPARQEVRTEPTLDDNPDIDTIEDLDLDLSPNAIGGRVEGRRIAPEGVGENISDIISGKEPTGPVTRNILLLLAAVVIIVGIYIYQVKDISVSSLMEESGGTSVPAISSDKTDLDGNAVKLSDNQRAADSTVTQDNTGIASTGTAMPAASGDSDVEPSGLDSTALNQSSAGNPSDNVGNSVHSGSQTVHRDPEVSQPATENVIPSQTGNDLSEESVLRLKAIAEAEAEARQQAQLEKAAADKLANDIQNEKNLAEAKAQKELKARQAAEARLESEAAARKQAEAESSAREAELERIRAQLQDSQQARVLAQERADQEARGRVEAEMRASIEAEAKMDAIEKARVEQQAKENALSAVALAQQEIAPFETANIDGQSASLPGAVSSEADTDQLPTVDASVPGVISLEDIDKSIRNLEREYQDGNIDGFINIFSNNARTSTRTDIAGIRNEYLKHFDSTGTRKIAITRMKWNLDDNFASGNGKFEAVYRPEGSIRDVKRTGGVILQLVKPSTEVRITRMYFSGEDGRGVFP